ncbi:MAG TPA: MFS transporter [Candidatus Baltobacteraceae bacterium]|nr:MFS transporter [Candidatus Baltobacteraceae bacterium]
MRVFGRIPTPLAVCAECAENLAAPLRTATARNGHIGDRRMDKATAPPDHEARGLWRSMVLIGAGVFATTLAQPGVLKLPLQYLLKTDLHVAPDGMATFFAIGALAWYFKPLAGILSDAVPLCGTRRRHYLLLSAAGAAICWALFPVVPRTYGSLLGVMIAVNAMLVIGSTVVGGLMVEIGQRHGATGRLTSARYFVQNACLLLGGPIAGVLATSPFSLSALLGAAVSFSVVPVAWRMLQEPRTAVRSADPWRVAGQELRNLAQAGPLWSAAGLLALVYIAPGFQTPLYYFQTDTLGLSQSFIGILGLLSGALGLIGAFCYGILCRRVSLRWLLPLGFALSALGTMSYLWYGSATAAAVIESGNGFLLTFAELALMDLAARATPSGSEGLGFALMMSVRNGGLALSDIFGSWLIERHAVSFFALVWLNAGTTALALLAVPFLPRLLVDRHDATGER